MTRQMMLMLTQKEVRRLLSIDECIAAVEQAFRIYGEGRADPPVVLSVHTPGGGFHVKAGLLRLERSYFVAKVNGNFPANAAQFGLPTIQGVIVLCDADNGTPLAVIDSREVTSLRTGAATAVAAKYLARRDSHVVTICGCGNQARVQLRAICREFDINALFHYDSNQNQAVQFSDEMAADLGIPVNVATELASATRQSDICVTCTPSRKPILDFYSVSPGAFIAAVGADNPEKHELNPNLMSGSKIVCDIVEQCAVMGDLHHALTVGAVKQADVYAELGEIVAGRKAGRQSRDEITIFDSTGMALQDVAAAAFLYERAERSGSGVRLDFAA